MSTTAQQSQLTTEQVAARAGVKTGTIRMYRHRGVFPEPDGYVGSTPWWHPVTVEIWIANRRRRGERANG